jgi:uncharacterized protein (TIGR04255 family)
MSFPESERVVYNKNPIEQVICQLRFPTLLRINSETPVIFQEKLRREYPLLAERIEQNISFAGVLQNLPSNVADSFPPGIVKAYDLTSADEQWTVTLTKDFLALTAKKYARWEDFRKHLILPLEALIELYSPVFFTRIGLRYQNVIRRSRLGLKKVSWSKLLKPYIVGILAADSIVESVQEIGHQIVLGLDKPSNKVRIVNGLVTDENDESCYLLDCDFFTEEQTEVSDAIRILDHFNQQNRLLFRWSISDKLHKAMDPHPVSDFSTN